MKFNVNQKDGQWINTFISTSSFFQSCLYGKQQRTKFPTHGRRTQNILELIHANVSRPMKTKTLDGTKYFISFIDGYYRFIAIYFLQYKLQFFKKFQIFKAMVKNQMEERIKVRYMDNGGEFVNKEFNFLNEVYGIMKQFIVP